MFPIAPVQTTSDSHTHYSAQTVRIQSLGVNSYQKHATQRSKSLTARTFKTVQLQIPDQMMPSDIRNLFGDHQFSASKSSTAGRSNSRSTSLSSSVMKGVRWRYNPSARTIDIEGRDDKKVEKAAEVFRERILMKMEESRSSDVRR
jgi:hypothetical protein